MQNQRMDKLVKHGLVLSFHILVLVVYVYSLVFHLRYVNLNGESTLQFRGYAGKFKYLTFWNLILQTAYFGLSVFCDLATFPKSMDSTTNNGSRILLKIRDRAIASVIFPTGMFVVVTFWSLYAINKDLVLAQHQEGLVPSWLNHATHTTVILFLVLEKIFVNHIYPGRLQGLAFTLVFALFYQLWVLWVAYHANIWIYPLLAILSWMGRLIFFGLCWCLFIINYLTGEYLTKIIWIKNGVQRKGGQKSP